MRLLSIVAIAVFSVVGPVMADYVFPVLDLVVTDQENTISLDTTAVPPANYSSFVLSVEFSFDTEDPGVDPWMEEATWNLDWPGHSVPLADPAYNTTFEYTELVYHSGIATSTLTWTGSFTQTYTGGPLNLRVRQARLGTVAFWNNITLTFIEGDIPAPTPPAAADLGSLVVGATSACDLLPSNWVTWFKFVTGDVQAADCDVLRIDTMGSLLDGGIYGDGDDSEIALYDSQGFLIATNDDIDQIGGELLSALAFGADEGVPVPSSGDLPAGEYYIAVAGFDTEFSIAGFQVIPDSAVLGSINLNVNYGFPYVDCNNNGLADSCDIQSGTSSDFNGTGIPDECEDCNDNGILDSVEIEQGTAEDCNRNFIPDSCELEPGIIRLYVDQYATGLNDGESWEDAYNSLQDAIHRADCASGITEIWVAAGTYIPAYGTPQRSDTFRLVSGVKLYGGFAGGEAELHERNVGDNVTVLSGDLAGNDEAQSGLALHCYYLLRNGIEEDYCDQFDVDGYPHLRETEIGIDENAYCVVTASGVNSDTLLDGFTITGGNGGSSEFIEGLGGGMFVRQSDLVVANCRFRTNQASDGGALAITEGQPVFVNCEFSGNTSPGGTGGVFVAWIGSATFTNCIIVQNFNSDRYNSGYYAGSYGLYNQAEDWNDIADYEVKTIVRNSICWGNSDSDGYQDEQIHGYGITDVTYTCTQEDIYTGIGNTDIDPLFVDFLGPDGVPGTGDEDYRLQIGSPLINYGDNAALPVGMNTDLDGSPRIGACVVDLGPYENQEFYFLGDADENCVIDIADYTDFKFCLERFGYERSPILDACTRVFDSDGDNDVDLADFAAFQRLFRD